jgi:hypothetical protein
MVVNTYHHLFIVIKRPDRFYIRLRDRAVRIYVVLSSGASVFPVACCGVSERIRLCPYLKDRDAAQLAAGSFNHCGSLHPGDTTRALSQKSGVRSLWKDIKSRLLEASHVVWTLGMLSDCAKSSTTDHCGKHNRRNSLSAMLSRRHFVAVIVPLAVFLA